jgi:hypothetical protein
MNRTFGLPTQSTRRGGRSASPWFWRQRRLGLVLVTLGAVLGCSKTMTIYTVPRHPEAEIYVNGQLRGKGSAQVKVDWGECSPRNMGVSARLGTCESHVEVRTQLDTTSVASGVALSLVSLVITLATQGGWWGIGSGMVLAAGGIGMAACSHEWPDSVAIPIQQCLSTAGLSVTVTDIPLHVAPSLGAHVLRVLPQGTCVRVEYCEEDWCQVTVLGSTGGTSSSTSGFVRRSGLRPPGSAECPAAQAGDKGPKKRTIE